MDDGTGRRAFLAGTVAGLASLAGCAIPTGTGDGQSTPAQTPTGTAQQGDGGSAATRTPTGAATGTGTPTPPETVGVETVASGCDLPVDIAFAPTEDRWYLVDRPGVISVHDADSRRDEPFLNLRDAVETDSEKGLLGLALHPEFASNRRVFVRYSASRRPGTPSNYSHTFVLAEFTATADGTRARRDSERTVMEIPQPQGNHNAGDIAFGPDELLYVPVGDGGAGGDRGTGHVDDWYDGTAGGNGQDVTENLLGSLLRIDIDADPTESPGPGPPPDDPSDNPPGYAIPATNPLVGHTGLDEHYAWGLRNPWRLSFDGDDCYVADVGQNRYEEVNLVERGGNYGWNVKEGTHCYGREACPDRTPERVRSGEPLLPPIIEYAHDGDPIGGVSVIGGYVYRGTAIPGLNGAYVFGDLRPAGRLFVAQPAADGLWPVETLQLAGQTGEQVRSLLAFGRDHEGEVYVMATGSDSGGVYRLVPAP